MGNAAKLRTLTVIHSRLVRDEPHNVGVQRNHVNLARQTRNPEAVDYVLGVQAHIDRATSRNVQLIRRHHLLRGIAELEPPAMTDRVNLQHLSHVRRCTTLLLPDTHDRRNCDHRDHDARDYRPRDLQLRVAVNLLRYRVVPLTITPHRIDDQTLNDHEHNHRYPEDQVEQVSLITGHRTVAGECRLRMLWRTRR